MPKPKHSIEPQSAPASPSPEAREGAATAAPSATTSQAASRPSVSNPGLPVAAAVSHVSPEMPAQADSSSRVAPDSAALPPEPARAPVATGQVHDAQLSARAERSEMRIALETPAFGSVEVHAVVRESQVGLAIGSERGDLHRIMAAEVPTIAGRLQQHDLQLDGVRFFDQGPSFSMGSDGTDSRSRSFSPPHNFTSSSSQSREPTRLFPEEELPVETGTGLNVRA